MNQKRQHLLPSLTPAPKLCQENLDSRQNYPCHTNTPPGRLRISKAVTPTLLHGSSAIQTVRATTTSKLSFRSMTAHGSPEALLHTHAPSYHVSPSRRWNPHRTQAVMEMLYLHRKCGWNNTAPADPRRGARGQRTGSRECSMPTPAPVNEITAFT